MRRVLTVLVPVVCLGVVAAPGSAAGGDQPPDQCSVMRDGQLPSCFLRDDGTWSVTYPEAGGIGGSGYATIFLLIAMAVVGVAVWRLTLARRAREPREVVDDV
jgi:hypothetical protein